MNLPRVRKTTLADEDLEEIWLYIGVDNIVAADALVDKLVAKSLLLASNSNPELGRARPEIYEGLRSFAVGNYILFYRPEPGGIELTRVLHGARDIDGSLF
jgi:toxin ParE1/3/4